MVLWFNFAIRRRAFIGWLAIKNKLSTRERIAQWGYNADCLCVFCMGCIEGRDH
jgi:hypothetical protein